MCKPPLGPRGGGVLVYYWGLNMRPGHSVGAGTRGLWLWLWRVVVGSPALVTWLFLVCLGAPNSGSSQALPLGSLPWKALQGLQPHPAHTFPSQSGRQRAAAAPRLSLTLASPYGKSLRMAKVWLGVRGGGQGPLSGPPSPPDPLQAAPSICGSSCLRFCRTGTPAPSTSSGPSERKASSSWWTPKLCPSCGGSRKTSLT